MFCLLAQYFFSFMFLHLVLQRDFLEMHDGAITFRTEAQSDGIRGNSCYQARGPGGHVEGGPGRNPNRAPEGSHRTPGSGPRRGPGGKRKLQLVSCLLTCLFAMSLEGLHIVHVLFPASSVFGLIFGLIFNLIKLWSCCPPRMDGRN